MTGTQQVFQHLSSTATLSFDRSVVHVKNKLSQTFRNDLRRWMHKNNVFYGNNFEHSPTVLHENFDKWGL